jgi:competence protein ComEC
MAAPVLPRTLRHDLRLAPTTVILWICAALGTRSGTLSVLLVLAATTLVVLVAGAVHRPLAHPLRAHLALLLLGSVLLVPTVHRHQASVDVLEDAATSGARVELVIRAKGDAHSASSTMPWAQDQVRVQARSDGGTARVGRKELPVPGHVPLLLTGPGTGSAGLGHVEAGQVLVVRATVSAQDGFFFLVPSAVRTVDGPDGTGSGQGLRSLVRGTARDLTSHMPADEAALARGMTTGDTEGMNAEVEEAMRRAGISHLVAVSGANIALVLAAVLVPLLLLGVRRRLRIPPALVVGGLYILLVGWEPSVLRAATMALPVLVARFVGVKASTVSALCMTVAVWSALDPATASSVGFVLSALATGAILVLSPPVARGLVLLTGERLGEVPALVVAVPLVAQLACTPVLILLTPEVSVWAVTVNMLVAPVVGPCTLLGLAAVVLGPVLPAVASVGWTVAGGGAHLIIVTASAADRAPGARIPVPAGTPGVLLAIGALAVVLTALCFAPRSRVVRFAVAAVMVLVLVPPVVRVVPLGPSRDWQIAACAIGQGDAVVLRAPGEDGDQDPDAFVVIDTGPEPTPLGDCLDVLEVDHVDLLVLTHPHADHTGGRQALTGPRTPAQQWVCPMDEARAQTVPGVPTRTVTRGVVSEQGALRVEVLWPTSAQDAARAALREEGGSDGSGPNDCSIVIDATWDDGLRYVGLADLEPAGQQALLALDPRPAPADVVKAAHHGSRRQEPEMYDALDAQVLVFTVGQDNGFGHPAAQALAMAGRTAAGIVRTDRDGTVLLDGAQLTRPVSVAPGR